MDTFGLIFQLFFSLLSLCRCPPAWNVPPCKSDFIDFLHTTPPFFLYPLDCNFVFMLQNRSYNWVKKVKHYVKPPEYFFSHLGTLYPTGYIFEKVWYLLSWIALFAHCVTGWRTVYVSGDFKAWIWNTSLLHLCPKKLRVQLNPLFSWFLCFPVNYELEKCFWRSSLKSVLLGFHMVTIWMFLGNEFGIIDYIMTLA